MRRAPEAWSREVSSIAWLWGAILRAAKFERPLRFANRYARDLSAALRADADDLT